MSGAEQFAEPPGQRYRRPRYLDDLVPAGRAGHQRDIPAWHQRKRESVKRFGESFLMTLGSSF